MPNALVAGGRRSTACGLSDIRREFDFAVRTWAAKCRLKTFNPLFKSRSPCRADAFKKSAPPHAVLAASHSNDAFVGGEPISAKPDGSRSASVSEVTQLLNAIEAGDTVASEKLLPLVYDELRKLAAHRLEREPPGQTLQATALVHEAYLRLIGSENQSRWDNCGHFFAAAATAMRRIMIDRARRKNQAIHGGAMERVELRDDIAAAMEPQEDLLALDAALTKLAIHDPLKARLVELRYFAGLTGDRAAEALGISARTADRHWVYARTWLRREVEGSPMGSERRP